MKKRTKLQYALAFLGSVAATAVELGLLTVDAGSGGLVTAVAVAAWGAIQSHYDGAKVDVIKGCADPKSIMCKVATARVLADQVKTWRKEQGS